MSAPVTREEYEGLRDAILRLASEVECIASDEEGRGPRIEDDLRQIMGMKTRREEWKESVEKKDK